MWNHMAAKIKHNTSKTTDKIVDEHDPCPTKLRIISEAPSIVDIDGGAEKEEA